MSIKRSKQRNHLPSRNDRASFFSFGKPPPEPEPEKSWTEHVTGAAEESFVPYSLKSHFAKGALIAHAKFGKGVIISVDGSHIEVLFEEGKKKLGHAVA
jgi:hypothetical protein